MGSEMTVWDVESVATELLACESERRARVPFTDDWPELDVATGYEIQDETLKRRLDRGERLVGVKLGLTNRAHQQRMGVDDPFVAWLTDAMNLPAGDPVPQSRLIYPRIEPEIVFVMRDRLHGPGITGAQAYAAVEAVYAGAEIVDSRYTNATSTGDVTAGDIIADNASCAAFVTGPTASPPSDVDLFTEGVLVEVNGEIVYTATGAAVQGHPAEALALAANELAKRGLAIEPGWIVLTGGMTDAVLAPPGSSVACHFGSLGSVFLNGGADPDAGP